MTMSQLIDQAVARGADRSLITSRLRHWAREGLIEPVGDHHPGSGRHRFFRETALEVALALNALADFNLPVGILYTAARELHREALPRGRSGSAQLYLEISRNPDTGKFRARVHEHEIPSSDCFMVLDLTKIWGKQNG
jgi:hypothetical protein